MPLDPNTCPIGTVGFLRILSTYEFEGFGDDGENGPFDDFKKPDVVLDAERRWRCDGELLDIDATVYATWQESVQATIDSDRENAEAMLREAQADLAQADKVQRWLNEGK